MRILAAALLAALLAPAQYPETVPRSGKPAKNPAHFPRNTRGIPLPSRDKKKAKTKEPAASHTLKGTLRKLDAAEIILTADDARTITAKRTDATRFYKAGKPAEENALRPGDRVSVDASRDEEGYFYALAVRVEREGTETERAEASLPVSPSVQRQENERPVLRRNGEETSSEKEDDSGEENGAPRQAGAVAGAAPDPNRPRLRRGKPVRRASASAPEISEPEASEPPVPARPAEWKAAPPMGAPRVLPEDPRLTKAREAASKLTESLPNYVCQQHIARFVSNTFPADWRAQDIITAALVFENGQERYTNLTVNGKPVTKRLEELGGTWSKGEFGSVLADLFDPSTAAWFRLGSTSQIAGRAALVFHFEVAQANSHWRVNVPAQALNPAYKGSLWVDAATSQPLRVELQASDLPKEFPLSAVESAIDFGLIRLSEREFLTPIHAEALSCVRGTNNCSRNVIDFRNYRKFDGQSTITF